MGKTIFIDISKYIDDLEKGLITQSTIMEIEGVSKGTLNNAINNYYQEFRWYHENKSYFVLWMK